MEKAKHLSQTYTQILLQEIQSGIYANADRLPAENDIAKTFGISRTLVRDCLAKLEREGFISRKHGIGTIINKHVLREKIRLDLEQEFLEMIKAAGYEPDVAYVTADRVEADEEIADKLQVNVGDKVIRSIRLITASGEPAIYCIDYIAERLLVSKEYDAEILLKKPIFEFIRRYCNTDVFMDLSEVQAVVASSEVAAELHVEINSPLLYIDEIGYNFVGQAVLYSQEYYKNGIFKQMILRKKI